LAESIPIQCENSFPIWLKRATLTRGEDLLRSSQSSDKLIFFGAKTPIVYQTGMGFASFIGRADCPARWNGGILE
jgi:hypothetical protein